MLYGFAFLSPSGFFVLKVFNLSSFSFMKRGAVRQFMTMAMREAVKSMAEEEKPVSITLPTDPHPTLLYYSPSQNRRSTGDSSKKFPLVILHDKDHSLLMVAHMAKVLRSHFEEDPHTLLIPLYPTKDRPNPPYGWLGLLNKWKYPGAIYAEMDKVATVHHQVDELKETMAQTITKVLERGVALDKLVEKSRDLSDQAKMFYTTSRKLNRCCVIL